MPTERATRTNTRAATPPLPDEPPAPALNLAVVAGTCSGPPDVRTLPSGTSVANLSVTVAGGSSGLATSVPVAVFDPPAWVTGLEAGERVVVAGRVRRRFFRAGGATASRVELEAFTIRRASDRRRVAALLRDAHGVLDDLAERLH